MLQTWRRSSRFAANLEWYDETHRFQLLFETSEVYGMEDLEGNGQLIATVTLSRFGNELAAIGMMLVAKEHGGRGHGRALMGHAMDAAGSVPTMLFATSAGRPLYEKLGFVTLDQNTSYKGRLASHEPVVSDAATAADLADIIELDRAVAGCDRQRMLTAYFSFADELRVLRDGSAIVGYAGTWTHQDYSVIGPVVAPNDAAARTLVHDVASTIDRPVRIQIAESRTALGEWATEHGFAPMATTSFMVHDGRPVPGDRERLYMPITLALG